MGQMKTSLSVRYAWKSKSCKTRRRSCVAEFCPCELELCLFVLQFYHPNKTDKIDCSQTADICINVSCYH